MNTRLRNYATIVLLRPKDDNSACNEKVLLKAKGILCSQKLDGFFAGRKGPPMYLCSIKDVNLLVFMIQTVHSFPAIKSRLNRFEWIFRFGKKSFGGKPLDLIIYILINKASAALMPHKYMSGPLVPPKIMCSLWLD